MKRDNIPDELRWAVMKRDSYACRYCGSRDGPFHMDHVYPLSKGGETTIENLVTACPKCNVKKSNRVGEWPFPLSLIALRPKLNYHFFFASVFFAQTMGFLLGIINANRNDYKELLWLATATTVLCAISIFNGLRRMMK